jgi:hypothetical protein
MKTQSWSALIVIFLIKYLQFKSRMAWSLSNLVALLRWNLFTLRNLWKRIDAPCHQSNPPSQDELKKAVLDGIPAHCQKTSNHHFENRNKSASILLDQQKFMRKCACFGH